MRQTLAVGAMTLFLCACAGHITIHKAKVNGTQAGVPWNLPMTQFRIAITRELKKCGLKPEAIVDATATTQQVVDDTRMYVLDNPGWLSSGKIESELTPRGISSGLTSEVTDETGPLLSEIFKGAASAFSLFALQQANVTALAQMTGVVREPAETATAPDRPCKPAVEEAVLALYPADEKGGLQEELETATEALQDATAKTARLSLLGGKSASEKLALVKAMAEMDNAARAVREKSKALANARRLTTQTVTVLWPTRGGAFRTTAPWRVDEKVLKKWFNEGTDWSGVSASLDVWAMILKADVTLGQWRVVPSLEVPKDGAFGTPTGEPLATSRADENPRGLPVRIAGDGMLVITTRTLQQVSEWPLGQAVNGKDIVLALEQPIFQVGTVYYVPMRGRAFHSESATVKLDEAGNPTSIHVGQSGAAATKSAAAANDLIGFVSGIGAAKDANALADLKAKTERYNAQIAYADAKAAAALSQSKAQASAKTSLAEANLAQMKAEDAVEEAKQAMTAQ